jgi:hypothetical protein
MVSLEPVPVVVPLFDSESSPVLVSPLVLPVSLVVGTVADDIDALPLSLSLTLALSVAPLVPVGGKLGSRPLEPTLSDAEPSAVSRTSSPHAGASTTTPQKIGVHRISRPSQQPTAAVNPTIPPAGSRSPPQMPSSREKSP